MAERQRDPYAILGVPRTASREAIGRAYRARAKQAHPDLSGQPSRQMQDLNWAWDVLSEARRRTAWDRDHPATDSAGHWSDPEPWLRPAPRSREAHTSPAWTVSGEPWAGGGAAAVGRRWGVGCVGIGLLMLVLSAFVLFGGFLSGYHSPGNEPAGESAPAENE